MLIFLYSKNIDSWYRKKKPEQACSHSGFFHILFSIHHALLTDPKSSIFSLTVALIASAPGARSLRGSYPLPC